MECKRQTRSSARRKVDTPRSEGETPEALLNDVVLQNIFKYLGYKDLKSCRDVKNSIWLRNSRDAWWSRTKVALKKEKVVKYLKETAINSCATNYKLESFGAINYKGFWKQLGHSIKYLELDFCYLSSVDEFRDIFYSKCPNLEKLVGKHLQINTSTVAVEPTEWKDPQFGEQKNLKFLSLMFNSPITPLSWMELLSHFPNLEAVEAMNPDVDIYRVISIIRQHDPKRLKLKHIDIRNVRIRTDYENDLPQVLLDPNLSLETIRSDYDHGVYQPEPFVDILDLHAKSLKELYLAGSTCLYPRRLSFRQPLLNLEILRLDAHLFFDDFLKCTPNLRKADLDYGSTSKLLECVNPNLRIDACKELTIRTHQLWRDWPNSNLEFFLNVFPNVEVLNVTGLDNEKFSMICERWTKLKSVTVKYDCEVDTFGLLGYDPDSKTEAARNPNITNLKDLQSISLWSKLYPVTEEETRRTKAIDVGLKMKNGAVVLKALEKLPQLKKFELYYYDLKEEQEWKQIFAKYPGDQ